MELKVLILIYLTKRLEIKTKNETLYNNLLIYITKLILQTDKVEHNWKNLLSDSLDLDNSRTLYSQLREFPSRITTVNDLDDFYKDIFNLIQPMADGIYQDHQIDPFSLFGLFIRKAYSTKSNLTFEGSIDLLNAFQAFISTDTSVSQVGQYEHQLLSWSSSEVDEIIPRRVEAFNEFQTAFNKSDIHSGSDSLRKFFDYRPSSINSDTITGSGSHQHALLSLASFFISQGVIEEARRVLNESLTMSRISKDIETLNGCNRLLRQLDRKLACPDPHAKSLASDDITVMDELFDIRVAIGNGDKLSELMTRSTRALVRLDEASALDKVDASLQTWAAVNAAIWELAGIKSIRDIYQKLATHGDTWHTSAQLTTRINISNQYAQNGDYTRALQCLFDEKLLSEINLVEYATWTEGVWAVLRRRSQRMNQHRKGPASAASSEVGMIGRIDGLISQCIASDGNRDLALEHLLLAFKMADTRQYFPLKLRAFVELVGMETRYQYGIDVGDSDGMFERAIHSPDRAVQARACAIYAEKAIADDDMRMAGALLIKAEHIYEKLQDATRRCDCLYALAGVWDRCGDSAKRDMVVETLVAVEEECESKSPGAVNSVRDKVHDKVHDVVSSLIQQWGIVIALRA